jgi:hypothetical protein
VRVYQFRHIRAVSPIVSALTPRPVVRLPEHGEVLEIMRHAAFELVAVAGAHLALNEGQVGLAAPTLPANGPVPLDPPGQPRPFCAGHEDDGADDEHERDDAHGLIVIRG